MWSRTFVVLVLCSGLALHGCGTAEPSLTVELSPAPTVNINVLVDGILDANADVISVARSSMWASPTSPVWEPRLSKWFLFDRGEEKVETQRSMGAIFSFKFSSGSPLDQLRDMDSGFEKRRGCALAVDETGIFWHIDENPTQSRLLRTNPDTLDTTEIEMELDGYVLPGCTSLAVTAEAVYFVEENGDVNFDKPRVLRLNIATNVVTVALQSTSYPFAGVTLNADATKAYIVEQDTKDADSDTWKQAWLYSYDVDEADGSLVSGSRLQLATFGPQDRRQSPRLAVDIMGNIWVSHMHPRNVAMTNSVNVYLPTGEMAAQITTTEDDKNSGIGIRGIAFGGDEGRTVMLTSEEKVWAIPTKQAVSTGKEVEISVAI